MRSGFCWSGFLTIALLVPALAADEKDAKKADAKDAKKAEPTEKQEPKEKWVSLGEVVGKLTRVEGSQKYLTVQVTQSVVVPTVGGSTVVRGRIVPSVSLQVRHLSKSIDVQAADEIKIRMLQPPAEFDEKGKPKKYTSKELQELKGPDPKLPGYQADFESLKPEQVVRVMLARKVDPAAAKGPAKPVAKTQPKKKDKDDEEPEEERPTATMIVILYEPPK